MHTFEEMGCVMAIQLLIALLIGFFISMLLGRKVIPWMEKKGFTQPLKEEVRENIYAEKNEDMPTED